MCGGGVDPEVTQGQVRVFNNREEKYETWK